MNNDNIEVGKMIFAKLLAIYGDRAVSRFSAKNENGENFGVKLAIEEWGMTLSKFPAESIKQALDRSKIEHVDHPPNLAQFLALCRYFDRLRAIDDVKSNQFLRIPFKKIEPKHVFFEKKFDGRDWARSLVARKEAGDQSVGWFALKCANEVLLDD